MWNIQVNLSDLEVLRSIVWHTCWLAETCDQLLPRPWGFLSAKLLTALAGATCVITHTVTNRDLSRLGTLPALLVLISGYSFCFTRPFDPASPGDQLCSKA